MPVPVAQLVERWTPCVESARPCYESPRARGATGACIYEPPAGGYGGWWQAAVRRCREGDRPCAAMCVHSTLNSATEQELCDRRVEDRANARRSA